MKLDSRFVNGIYNTDCVAGMAALPGDCIPMTLTSPPYDDLRSYGGHGWDFDTFRRIADQLWRVTMPGGVVVWVVADRIVDGSETGTSARQKLYFRDVGFDIYHTMIMDRVGSRWPSRYRYGGSLEYAFILSKGKPRTIHLLRDKPNRQAGMYYTTPVRRLPGRERPLPTVRAKPISELGVRSAVWTYATGGRTTAGEPYVFEHEAPMPEAMARDHILSWSRPGDLVLDPMGGAGTTAKMAVLNHRRFLAFEVHEPYYRIALRRVADAQEEYQRRLDDWLMGGSHLEEQRFGRSRGTDGDGFEGRDQDAVLVA
jgi:site-specific DNA-methyltransferase (adenine-specific)